MNTYQLIGAVNIGRVKNPTLVDQTNREGLQESPALNDMERFSLSVIEKFELAAGDFARKVKNKTTPKHKDAKQNANKAREQLGKVAEQLKKHLSSEGNTVLNKNIAELEAAVKDSNKAAEKNEKIFEEKAKELQLQKDTLSNLASVGILAIAFGHETTQDANTIVMYASDFMRDYRLKKLSLSNSQLSSLENLVEKAKFLNGLSSFYLGTVNVSKRKRKDVSPLKSAVRVRDALMASLERQNIDFVLLENKSAGCKVTSFEIDFESLYVNLTTNSIYALNRTPKGRRKIKLEFKKRKDRLIIEFSDSGRGVTKSNLDAIFAPMFSTRKSARGEQIGTGMGLFICKNIVEEHMNGSIRVIGKGSLGGATICIDLPISTRGRK